MLDFSISTTTQCQKKEDTYKKEKKVIRNITAAMAIDVNEETRYNIPNKELPKMLYQYNPVCPRL